MTIKTGPIKLGADGAAELGLPVTGKLTLGDARVRQLAGKPSGPLKLSDLQGKTRPPPYGTLLSTFCSGYTKMGRYADGNYGSYDAVIANNSPECGWNPPPRGTFIRQYCRGYTLIGVYADGSYGTYESVIANNSPTCGYVPPPAYGTLLSTFCASRYDLWGVYANGSGGSYNALIEYSSRSCGYGSGSSGTDYESTGSESGTGGSEGEGEGEEEYYEE